MLIQRPARPQLCDDEDRLNGLALQVIEDVASAMPVFQGCAHGVARTLPRWRLY